MSTLKQRFLLVSDMHYTTEETHDELKRTHPEAIATAAAGKAFGKTQKEKIEKIHADICAENNRSPLDAVLVLGDLSVDDYDFRHLPDNYCRRFKEECMDRLPTPAYAIPGNHDSYPVDMWRDIFGYDREYALEFGDTVFIMADTFASVPAAEANPAAGAPHTPLNETLLRTCLEKYREKKIFICAHNFDANVNFNDSVKQMIKENNNIVCLFRGHTHISGVVELGDPFGGKQIIDIGGYGYCGQPFGDRWEFNIFDRSWAWGYEIIEIFDDRIKIYHVRTANEYLAVNGNFTVKETVEDVIEYRI